MKILVIDDTQANLETARQTLAGHELTLVSSYDEAYRLLQKPRAKFKAVDDELVRRGFTLPLWKLPADQMKAADEEKRCIEDELRPPPPFDVVLCDLLMPAGEVEQGVMGRKYVGQEMPVGWALALMAVLQGAKFVMVVTNLNHHLHPAAAMLDRLQSVGYDDTKVLIRVNGVPVDFMNDAPMITVEGTSCSDCDGSGKQAECYRDGTRKDCNTCCGTGKILGKDWGRVLARRLGNG